jgi:hypothetical protein
VRAVRILYLSLCGLVACGPSNRDGNQPDASSPDAPASHDGSATDTSRVYAHSGSTLFRIDTQNLGTVQVGAMTGLGTQSLTDLAIDKDDHIVQTTGDATKIGSYGTVALGKVVSSGDLIGVRGLGIYATVDINDPNNPPDPNANDYLARIDPTTWTATPLGTGTGFNNIFGLGFWAGKIYGFVDDKTSHTGKIIEIDPNTGAGHEILSGAQEWYGAGVTTDAPILQ